MRPWKKTGQAISMATDLPIKGKWRQMVNRMVRAQLKNELTRELKTSRGPGPNSNLESHSVTSSQPDEPSEI